jgi:hypothetical protein
VKTPAPDTTTVAAPDATTAHTWQLLDLKGNDATFLVDGKKVAGKALKAEIVTGYTYNSVTNATCVTVLHDAKAFALCSGAAPFPA